jgi:hypothetical protein
MQSLLEEALDARDPRERVDMLHQIRTELMAHERMEEDVFYPALRARAEAKDIVLDGYEEHHVIDLILDELLDTPEESDEWKPKLKVLQENIEHHIEEEEGEMFRQAKKAFEKEELEELGEKMEATKLEAIA